MKAILVMLVSFVCVGALVADQTVDIRYGWDRNGSTLRFLEWYQGHQNGIVFPDVARLELPQYGYRELAVGGGKSLVASDKLTVVGLGYYTTSNDGQRWLQLAFSIYGQRKKVVYSAFASGYAPLNGESIGQLMADPVELGYRFNDKWTIGLSSAFYKFEGEEWSRRIGPMVQCNDQQGFWQFRALTNGDQKEFWFRRVCYF